MNTALNVGGLGSQPLRTSRVRAKATGTSVLGAVAASSSTTGSLVVGALPLTAATSVGIGGGNINAGGTLTVPTIQGTVSTTGNWTFSGSLKTGTATANSSTTFSTGNITAYASGFPFGADIIDPAASGINVGGGLAFAGNDGTIVNRLWAGIQGGKENSTASNYSAYLAFFTRANGGTMTEKGRFSSTGGFMVGNTTDPGATNLSVTGTSLLTGGIIGVSTNSNATAGNVGEYVSSLVAVGSAVSLTTATPANVTSISLTAGDWDVEANSNYTETTATASARSAGISSTSATLPTDGSEAYCGVQSTLTSEINTIALSRKRFSLSGTTTIYLVAQATFSAGTVASFGTLTARRIR